MPFTHEGASFTICAVVGALLTFANPNWEARDVTQPWHMFQKMPYSLDIRDSRTWYAGSYALTGFSTAAIGYLALTRRLRE